MSTLSHLSKKTLKRMEHFGASGGHRGAQTNGGVLDAHMWLEDENGRVVADPDFREYDYVKSVRGCSGRAQYKAWEGEKAKEALTKIQGLVQERMEMTMMVNPSMTKKEFWACYRNNPVHGCCFINALAHWKKNKHLKIKVGSMGWKKAGRGAIWWEYGDGLKGN